jgi:serine/threonine protein kinase
MSFVEILSLRKEVNNYDINHYLSPSLGQLKRQRVEILHKIDNIQFKWQNTHTSAGKARYKATITDLEEQLANCEISIIKLTQDKTELKREREEFAEYISRLLTQEQANHEINVEEQSYSIGESVIDDPTENLTLESLDGSPTPWELIALFSANTTHPNKYTSALLAMASVSRIAYITFLNFKTLAAPLKKIAGQPVKFYRSGKVKLVYIPINQNKDDPLVFYIAKVDHVFDSIYNLKNRELYEEVQTTKQIRFNLHKIDLLDLLKDKRIKNSDRLIDQLFTRFNSLDQLIEAMEAGSFEEKAGIKSEEIQDLIALKEDIKAIAKKESHLAIDYEEIPNGDLIYKRYIVKTALAKGDLEHEITKIDFKTKIRFISDILEGWENLHRAGFVHGDPKMENILVYETNKTLNVRLSDFGKTKQIKENEDLIYLGNPRHEPYERRLSKQGEVYSAAIILIRILEEEFLNDKGWLLDKDNNTVKPQNSKASSIKVKRKGIEKFLLKNAKIRQMETVSFSGKINVYSQRIIKAITPFYFSSEQEVEREIELYIDALTNKLEASNRMDFNRATSLNILLKDMIKIDRTKRPTLKEVRARFQRIIFNKKISHFPRALAF